MKRFFLSLTLTFIAATSFGQGVWGIDFEVITVLDRVLVDTIHDPNNIWQIGHPNKLIFNTAYSNPNAIVTDTLGFYPTNDTSSFTIIHLASLGWVLNYPKVDIGGWYYVNSDTLTDYGYIDFSTDLGNTWYKADSSEGSCSWGAVEELPTFTGNSNGWKHFYYCLTPQSEFPIDQGDTILYRFTFISDSVQTNKEGLMFDDLHFEDWAEGIEEFQNDNLISIFPNPTSDRLTIERARYSDKPKIQIINYNGQVIVDDQNFIGTTIDTQLLTNGIYLLMYSDSKNFAIKKFAINH